MSKFDTSRWKNFKLSDLFEIGGSKTTPKNQLEKMGNGNYPYVTTQATTNGIAGYYATYTEKGHCLTIDSAVLGTCFYQEFDFSASDHVEILRPKFEMSKEVAIFFTILINKIGNILGYAYNKKRSQKALKDEFIKLPVKQNGEIDFEYMEMTIKNTKFQMQNILNAYKSLIQRERESKIWNLDFSSNSILSEKERSFIWGGIMQIAAHLAQTINCEWREFALTELFTYERGTRLTKNDRINGKYPLVTAGEYNKGVKEYISNLNQKVFKNAITIDMFCNSFVHIDEFCCDDNVLVLTSKTPISKETMIFISSIINKDKDKWGYEKQYRQNSLEKHKISLPVDKFGKPNFEIMEKFIKEIEKNHTSKLLAYYHKIMANGGAQPNLISSNT